MSIRKRDIEKTIRKILDAYGLEEKEVLFFITDSGSNSSAHTINSATKIIYDAVKEGEPPEEISIRLYSCLEKEADGFPVELSDWERIF